jgi:dsRNA-specific ribonuclease
MGLFDNEDIKAKLAKIKHNTEHKSTLTKSQEWLNRIMTEQVERFYAQQKANSSWKQYQIGDPVRGLSLGSGSQDYSSLTVQDIKDMMLDVNSRP